MSRFIAEPLDLSRLPPFQLVAIDYESDKDALIAAIKARFEANGVQYSVDMLETDSAVVLAREFAYRRMLTLQAINDAGKRLTLATSWGAALDHIAATYYADLGLQRLVISPADPSVGAPAALETDERFRRRIALAPEARTPGTLGGYEFWALTAAPHLDDVRALNHASGLCGPGQIIVVCLGKAPDPDAPDPPIEEAAQIELARTFLLRRDVRLGDDVLSVRAAVRTTGQAEAVLRIRSGPAPALVLEQARKQHDAYVADRRRIGKLVARSSLAAAFTVGGVESVVLAAPLTDLDPGVDGVVEMSTPLLTTEAIGD